MKNIDKKFLKIAVNQAKKSVKLGGFPAGAVVVQNEKIISRGVSLGHILHDPTSHAETSSIRKACKKIKSYLDGATLYASLEPCIMCFQVSNWAEVSRIVYGCKKTEAMAKKGYYEGINDVRKINKKNNRQIEMKYIPDFEKEMLELVSEWENK
ncbi:MAG TPA: nucleoside deaminase [Candidatus Methanoperedens sp.]|nr:nucleoside deaminase [Candidatus Methanoperedens sp.]